MTDFLKNSNPLLLKLVNLILAITVTGSIAYGFWLGEELEDLDRLSQKKLKMIAELDAKTNKIPKMAADIKERAKESSDLDFKSVLYMSDVEAMDGLQSLLTESAQLKAIGEPTITEYDFYKAITQDVNFTGSLIDYVDFAEQLPATFGIELLSIESASNLSNFGIKFRLTFQTWTDETS